MNPDNKCLSDNCPNDLPITKFGSWPTPTGVPVTTDNCPNNPINKFDKVMDDFNRHLSVAVHLIGDDPDLTIDNSEYLRALSEMVCDLNGLDTCDHKESMALLIVALAQKIHN